MRELLRYWTAPLNFRQRRYVYHTAKAGAAALVFAVIEHRGAGELLALPLLAIVVAVACWLGSKLIGRGRLVSRDGLADLIAFACVAAIVTGWLAIAVWLALYLLACRFDWFDEIEAA